MQDLIPIDRVLVSVSDKSYLNDMVSGLFKVNPNLDILSTGGTFKQIREAGYPVREVSDYTKFPESPDGLLKTLHPAVHGGILLNHQKPEHTIYVGAVEKKEKVEILPINLVVVNFYPFSQMIADGADLEKLRKHGIDIGGPAMTRSAAKSFPHVAVVTDPESYAIFMMEYERRKGTTLPTRFRLACRAFALVTEYDQQISENLATMDPAEVAKYYRALKLI
jgi:phosphoribosylaminoimidazolecarboxamide formyltransferase / IMP cyclohydrolase